ncbi:hypothetical protein RSAG8_08877, partial [Rhizoctonia solani AG-8 WAC10335]
MVRYPEPTRGASLLVALKPAHKPVLVVGSGSLAATRIFSALEADACVLIASRGSIRHACEEVQWRVYHGDAEWLDTTESVADEPDTQQAAFGALLDANPGIQLVCVTDTLNATEAVPKRSAASAKAIARACRDRRIWVNVADMPALCDFTFPATHRFALSTQCRDNNLRTVDVKSSALQLAVTANGHGCRLASRLKREVIARLPRNVGDAVDNVGRLRLMARSEDEDPEALSSAIAMHDSGVQFAEEDDPSPINKPVPQRTKDETPAERCARRMRWVAQLSEYTSLEKLAEILAIIPRHVEVRVAKKYPGNAEHAQDEFIQLAIEGARAGKCVVRLKQGDPYLYGRGGEELLAFQSVQPPLPCPPLVIPGISSALSAPLLSTIPVTQRNVADSLVICTAVGKGGKGGVVLGYERTRSVVILMGVARLGELVRCLITGTSEGAATGKRIVGGLSSTKPVAVPVVPVAPVPTAPAPAASSSNLPTATVPPISTSTSTSSQTITPQPRSPNPNTPPTPITSPLTLSGPTNSPLTLSGPVYPPSTPIAIIERASMPDQRLIATSLDRVERALEREGGGRPPGMIIVGWAVVALAKSGKNAREETDGGIVDIKGDGLGPYDEARDRARLEQWLGGREYAVREGMEDGWEIFAGLGA